MSILKIWQEIIDLKLEEWTHLLTDGKFDEADQLEEDITEFNEKLIEDLLALEQDKSEEYLRSTFEVYTNFKKQMIIFHLNKAIME